MRRIVCSVLLIAVGMVFGAVAGEAMESRTYPMSVFFEEKLYAAAESAGIPCQWDDSEKWHLSVFELLGVDWPEGASIKRIKSLGTIQYARESFEVRAHSRRVRVGYRAD